MKQVFLFLLLFLSLSAEAQIKNLKSDILMEKSVPRDSKTKKRENLKGIGKFIPSREI